jgi:hypothetical protein
MHHFFAVHRTNLFIKGCEFASVFKGGEGKNINVIELIQPLVPMCYGKHKVLPILWMVRDGYMFDHTRRQKTIATKAGLIAYYYKQLTCSVKTAKIFLRSEECQQLKKSFRDVISDVVSNKESDILFEGAFKSYIKCLVSKRNEIIIKIILKLFIPNSFIQGYKKYNKKKYASGIEDIYFSTAFNKIRSSVIKFKNCYDD